MSIERTKLPYDYDALEPHISSETMHYHYEKHYSGYVDRLRDLVSSTPLSHLALDQIVSRARESGAVDILDNALQVWNHEFLWQSMSPSGETQPEGRIKSLVEENFGDVAAFKRRFRKAAMSQFGSGWVWLVQEGDRLRLLTTSNAESPLGTEVTPLLTLDLWEHAYYLDYRNERARYVDAFLNKLINWKFAAANVQPATATLAA